MSPIASIDDTEITLEEIKRMRQEMLRLQEEHDIKQLCEVLSVPRSTYYQYKCNTFSLTSSNEVLKPKYFHGR